MKIKALFSALLAAAISVTAAVTPLAANAPLLMGDIDSSGDLKASDARTALRKAVSLEELSEKQTLLADVDFNDQIDAADARLILRASVGLEKLDVKVALFNKLVNALKATDKNTFSSVSKTKTDCNIRKLGSFIGIDTGDMEQDETQWSAFSMNNKLTNSSYPIPDTANVSLLTDSDVKGITAQYMDGIDFIKALPDSAANDEDGTNNFTKLKSSANMRVLKLEVTLSEAFAENAEDRKNSVMGRIYTDGYNDFLASMFDTFNMDGMEEFEKLLSMEKGATSDVTVSYYFDAESFAPIAARYNLKTDVQLDMTLKFPWGKFEMDTAIEFDYDYFFNDSLTIA